MKKMAMLLIALLVAALPVLAMAVAMMPSHAAHAASGDPGTPDSRVSQSYDPDRQKAAFRPAQSVADAVTVATLTSTTTGRVILNGRQNVSVSCRFSSAGASCKYRLLYCYVDALTGTEVPYELSASEATLTATSYTDAGGLYMSNPYVFDGAGATHVRPIMSGSVSAGTATTWIGTR